MTFARVCIRIMHVALCMVLQKQRRPQSTLILYSPSVQKERNWGKVIKTEGVSNSAGHLKGKSGGPAGRIRRVPLHSKALWALVALLTLCLHRQMEMHKWNVVCAHGFVWGQPETNPPLISAVRKNKKQHNQANILPFSFVCFYIWTTF